MSVVPAIRSAPVPAVASAGETESFEIVIAGRKAWVFRRAEGGAFYVKGNIGGAQFFRSTGFKAKGMALDAAKKLWRARLEGRLEALEAVKLKRERPAATIGDLVRAHALAAERGRLAVRAEVGRQYRSCLRRLVAWGLGVGIHGREDNLGRVAVDEGAVDAVSARELSAGLIEEFGQRYCAPAGADFLAQDRRLRAAHSIVRNARAMFERGVLRVYEGLELPDLSGFMEGRLREVRALEHEGIGDEAVRAMAQAAREFRETDPGLYVAHLLFRHLGMRNDEIENARWEWLERLECARQVWLPNGECREVAALMRISRRSYWTPKASAGEVAIAPCVWGELTRGCLGAPTDFLVPARTGTERWEVIYRRHSDFVRPWTEGQQKTSYELRRWGATCVARLHQSEEMASRFLRHAPTQSRTAVRHYLTARPLPAPITLGDVGVG